jgi:hypothetical protein
MCCPKGKCGCQYFILLTLKKKSWTQGIPWEREGGYDENLK